MSPILKKILFTRPLSRAGIIVLSVLSTFTGILSPICQKQFIDRFHEPLDTTILMVLIFSSFVLIILSLLLNFLSNYWALFETHVVQRQLGAQLYNKMLALKIDTMSNRPVGEVISLYAVDVPGGTSILELTLPQGCSTFIPLLIVPLALHYLLNIPYLPIFIFLAVFVAINTFLAIRQSEFFLLFKQLAGERISLVNEWIQNIRSLRILSWVEKYEELIFKKRIIETQNRIRMVTNGQLMNAISSSSTYIFNSFLLIYIFSAFEIALSPGDLLALLWIVGVFLTRPFRQLPWFFTLSIDALTSIKRLDSFNEIENSQPKILNSKPKIESPYSIYVENLNLEIRKKQILKNINLKIKEGELVAIVGEVGSGKSLLLSSLLGETGASFDSYNLHNESTHNLSKEQWRESFSFVPQEGFIMSATLRDNVAFHYDHPNDNDVVLSNSLELAQYSLTEEATFDGLDTQIGERGVNLSGGQKQRVSLARVHYKQSAIILLDDCFSALDVRTERKLVHELLLGAWKYNTRVIATQRLTILPYATQIIFLDRGEVHASGTFDQLIKENKKFIHFTQSLQVKDKENEKR